MYFIQGLLKHNYISYTVWLCLILAVNTLRPRQNFCRHHFHLIFREWKLFYFGSNFIEIDFQRHNLRYDNIVEITHRHQAIIPTNDGRVHWRKYAPLDLDALEHYRDVIMGAVASQTTSLTIVYSTVYSEADQRKHQSSASLTFVWGIHRRPVNSPHKWPVTRKMFPFDDVIMWLLQEIQCTTFTFINA